MKKSDKKRAIYYQGLGGGLQEGMFYIFQKLFSYKLRHRDLDYYDIWETDQGKEFMKKEIEIAKNADCIFGISLGGYVAFHVARATGKKCVLINPALDRSKTLTGIYDFDMNYTPQKFELSMYIDPDDDVVPSQYTFDYIDTNNIDAEIYLINEMGHSPSYEHVVEILKHSKI
jgi:predicted alpha/beta hydrolase family esterase